MKMEQSLWTADPAIGESYAISDENALRMGVSGHTSAISFALENNLNLSIGITSTSSIQIALFVVPLLVFAGILLRKPVTLMFTIFELVAIFAASVSAYLISSDGRSNWFQGAELLSVYMILVAAFYFL